MACNFNVCTGFFVEILLSGIHITSNLMLEVLRKACKLPMCSEKEKKNSNGELISSAIL